MAKKPPKINVETYLLAQRSGRFTQAQSLLIATAGLVQPARTSSGDIRNGRPMKLRGGQGGAGSQGAGGPALLPLSSRIVYIADSITANRGFPGYADWSQFFTRGRFYGRPVGSNGLGPTGWNQGVVGNTTDQVIARLQNVIDEQPSAVVLGPLGTNDIGANSRDAAYITTRKRTIIDTLKAGMPGVKIFMCTMIPRIAAGWTGDAVKAQVIAWEIAQTDVTVVRTDLAITDPATQLQADGTHPNGLGAQPMGTVLAAALNAAAVSDSILYARPTAPAENLFLNPFFVGGSTVATSWTFFQAANGLTKTPSKVIFEGNEAQKIVWSGTASANVADNLNQNITPPGGLAGDLFECWVEVLVNRYTGFRGIGLGAGNNTLAYSAMSVTSQDTVDQSPVPFRGVLRAPPSPLLANGGTLNPRLTFIPANGAVCDAEVLVLSSGYRKVPTGQ
jgi:lysophospholipase L1-like esterase